MAFGSGPRSGMLAADGDLFETTRILDLLDAPMQFVPITEPASRPDGKVRQACGSLTRRM